MRVYAKILPSNVRPERWCVACFATVLIRKQSRRSPAEIERPVLLEKYNPRASIRIL